MKKVFSASVAICIVALLAGYGSSCTKTNTVTKTVYDTIVKTLTDTVIKNDTIHMVTAIIQPGPNNGQDAYVGKEDNVATDGNTNVNNVPELIMVKAFAGDGQLATWRSFIRFDSIAQIPANAKIISATLRLFGETSSPSHPQGNSAFNGSGGLENSCYIQKVTGGTWDQTTITFNNAPATTADGQITLSASTSQWDYNAEADVTDFVKGWVASPGTNFGMCMRLVTEQPVRAMLFASSEASASSRRPQLVVKYQY